jgi:hypothetical protein
VLRARSVGGDEGQIDHGCGCGQDLDLRLLGGLADTPDGHSVTGGLDVVAEALLDDVVVLEDVDVVVLKDL